MAEIKVTLPDESTRTLPEGSTGADLAADVGRSLAKAAIALTVNGETKDLSNSLSFFTSQFMLSSLKKI